MWRLWSQFTSAMDRLDDCLWGDAIGAFALFALLISGLFLAYGTFG